MPYYLATFLIYSANYSDLYHSKEFKDILVIQSIFYKLVCAYLACNKLSYSSNVN